MCELFTGRVIVRVDGVDRIYEDSFQVPEELENDIEYVEMNMVCESCGTVSPVWTPNRGGDEDKPDLCIPCMSIGNL